MKDFFAVPPFGGRRGTHSILKISSKSVPNFLTYVEHRQTDNRRGRWVWWTWKWRTWKWRTCFRCL